MGTDRLSFLKNTIAIWLAGHQDDLRPLTFTLSAVSSSSLLFRADSRHLHMSVPSFVGSLDPLNSSSEEVFVVTSPEDPDSDQRFNAALLALNEKLERLRPDADALHVAMEYLIAALKKYQGKSAQSFSSEAHQCAQSGATIIVDDDGDDNDDDDDDHCHSDEESDDTYYNADEVDFGYDMASIEDANRHSTPFVEMRVNGYLYAMVVDAKQRCDRARQTFSSPPETVNCAREDLENSVLAWCCVEPVPEHLLVHIKMQVGGIVINDAAAASLGLSVDFPMCISLQFDKEHWCRKENNCPLKVAACVVKATEMKANMTKEEERQFVKDLDKRHHFGEEVFIPELVDCYFRYLETHDKSVAKSADILEDLTTQTSNKNVFLGLICFLAARLSALPNWCVVCWNTLPYKVGRLRTCDRELCLYRFEELGLGTTVLQEVQKHPELFDFEVSLAIAALNSDRDVFEPFPAFLLEGSELRGRSGWFSKKVKTETNPFYTTHTNYKLTSMDYTDDDLGNKNLSVLRSVLNAYPSVDDMQSCFNEVELKKMLTKLWQTEPREGIRDVWKEKLWLPYDVLRFLLSTTRLTMYPLQESEALSPFKNAIYQFAVLHDNPEKEAHFQKSRKIMGGSFFAFHGSSTGNWYSILRNGLRSLSYTAYMSTGAAHGSGIYTASHMSTSCHYLRSSMGWKHGKLHSGFTVMAICEIVEGSVVSSISDIMVVRPECEEDILIRYILVFPGNINYHWGAGAYITSTTLRTYNNSVDLLNHHRGVRKSYHEKKESEWRDAREVRWVSSKAMCKNEEEGQRTQAASSRVGLGVKRFNVHSSTPGCIQAIQKELKNIMNQINAAKRIQASEKELNGSMLAGIEIDLPDETNLRRWHVHLSQHVFKGCPLYNDLAHYARHNKEAASVKLECTFPDTFPMAPPFIRVVSPRFRFHTGHVTVGGSICMELLTESGWSPAFCFESVLVQIISAMMEGGARLDHNFQSEYSENEARAAFDRVARDHGWIKDK